MGALGAVPGVVESGKIPNLSAAEAKRNENYAKRLARPVTRELNDTRGSRIHNRP